MAIGKRAIGDLAIGGNGAVDSPSDNYSLTPSGLVASSPVLGAPALSVAASNTALTAAGITAGNPALASSAVAQQHNLAATALATAAPSLGVPALTEIPVGVLSANGITTGAPLLGTPALAQAHVLSAGAIAAGGPVFGQVSLAQQHAMIAGGLSSGNAQLFKPALTSGGTISILPAPPAWWVRPPKRIWMVKPAPRRWIVKYLKNGDIMPLPDKDPEEVKTVTFDFSGDAEALTEATVIPYVIGGRPDEAPGAVLGEKSVEGSQVNQRVQAGQSGTDYALRCKAVDADGEVHVAVARLPVKTAVPQ